MPFEFVLTDDGEAIKVTKNEEGGFLPLVINTDNDDAEPEAYDVMNVINVGVPGLRKEAKQNREAKQQNKADADQLREQLGAYKVKDSDDGPIYLDPAEAQKALNTVKTIDQKKLVDAGEADKMVQQATAEIKSSAAEREKSLQTALDTKQSEFEALEFRFQDSLILDAFNRSAFLREKTTLTPAVAKEVLGKAFKVEEVNGEMALVGKMRDEGGELVTIFDPERPSQPAGPEYAIKKIFQTWSERSSYEKGTNAGGSNDAVRASGNNLPNNASSVDKFEAYLASRSA